MTPVASLTTASTSGFIPRRRTGRELIERTSTMTVAVSSGASSAIVRASPESRGRWSSSAPTVVRPERLGRLGRRARLPGHRLVEPRGPRPAHRRRAQRGGVELVGAREGGRHPPTMMPGRSVVADQREEVRRPGVEGHVQALGGELVAGALEALAVEPVRQLPGSSRARRPTAGARAPAPAASERLTTTRWRESGLDQHQATSWRCGVVVRPALARAQPPVAVAQAGVGDGPQQPLVERAQIAVAAARRARGRGRPGSASAGPRAGRRGRGARPGSVDITTAAARACAGANVAAARGSSWFSMNRSSRSW